MDILSFLIGLITGGKGKVDPSDATATAGDILSPKTAYIAGGKATGQIQSQAAQTITPTAFDQTIAAGKYLAGAQTVEGVVCGNLTAANIRKDVTVKIGTATDDDSVGSVTGSYEGEAPSLQDKTVTPTNSQQVVSADSGYDGLDEVTVEGVVCTNLTAANIKDGVVVKIGTATDDDSVTSVTGEYQGGGGGGGLTIVRTEGTYDHDNSQIVSKDTFSSLPRAVFGCFYSLIWTSQFPVYWLASEVYYDGFSESYYGGFDGTSFAIGPSSAPSGLELSQDGKLVLKVNIYQYCNGKKIRLYCVM